jgi:hypothetical protein
MTTSYCDEFMAKKVPGFPHAADVLSATQDKAKNKMASLLVKAGGSKRAKLIAACFHRTLRRVGLAARSLCEQNQQ